MSWTLCESGRSAMTPFTFVAVSDGSGKVSKAHSTQVRKQCMIGKNKKQNSRRSKREARRNAAVQRTLPSSALSKSSAAATPGSSSLSLINKALDAVPGLCINRDIRVSMATLSSMFRNEKNWHVPPLLSWPEPMKVGGEVLSSASQELLHQFAAYSRSKHALFPIEKVVDFDSYKVDHSKWLANDDLFFHSALYSIEALTAFATYRPISSVARLHLQESLLLLNHRLSACTEAISDATIFSIVNLIITASCLDQDSSLRAHLSGVKKICDARGILQRNPKLAFKLDNIDLRWTLLSGDDPTFLTCPQSWKPVFPGILPLADDRLLLHHFVPCLDLTIVEIYHDMQQVVRLAVVAYNNRKLLAMPRFQAYTHSCQARLLHAKCHSEDYLSEALRLSLLAFMTTCFSVSGRPLLYKTLASRIISAIQRFKRTRDKKEVIEDYSALILWMLIMVKMANPEENNAWMQAECDELLKESGERTWESARASLMKVLWIPPLHDVQGQIVYEKHINPI